MQLAGDVAADGDLRVDDDVDARSGRVSSLVTESTRKGMSSVTTSTTVWLHCQPFSSTRRGVHPDVRGALRAVLGEPVVGERGTEDVDRVAVDEVLRGGVQVVALEERGQRLCVEALARQSPHLGCSQRPALPVRAARPWLRPAWSACPLAPVARHCVT